MNEPSSHEDDLLDEALAAVRRMPTPERPSDRLVLESLHQVERGRLSPAPNTLYQRVLRMHPFVRYGIVTLVGSVLLLIGFGTRSGTLLLADVMKAVAKHQDGQVRDEERVTGRIVGRLPGRARVRETAAADDADELCDARPDACPHRKSGRERDHPRFGEGSLSDSVSRGKKGRGCQVSRQTIVARTLAND